MHGTDAARRCRRLAGLGLAALAIVLASAARADPPGAAFRITDELGPGQIEELIVVAGELRL